VEHLCKHQIVIRSEWGESRSADIVHKYVDIRDLALQVGHKPIQAGGVAKVGFKHPQTTTPGIGLA
jgi:hypothetical protein